jgi:hypothetical protein
MSFTVLRVSAKMALPLLVAAFAIPGFGDVDFLTSGTFTCGAVVGCVTSNGGSTVTVTNNNNTLQIIADNITNLGIVPPDDVNVITLETTSTNRGGAVDTTGLTFTLNIDQTQPAIAPTTGSLSGSFSGSINANGSNTIVTFAPNQTSLTLGGNFIYTLDFLDPNNTSWTIPNPGIGETGVTTETATVTSGTVTPEPTFMMLSGLGFAGLTFVTWRRKQAV